MVIGHIGVVFRPVTINNAWSTLVKSCHYFCGYRSDTMVVTKKLSLKYKMYISENVKKILLVYICTTENNKVICS